MNVADAKQVVVAPPGDLDARLASILAIIPPLIRLPKPGQRCQYCGLSRTGLVDLIAPTARNDFSPPVNAIYLKRNERARRGVWLIPADHLFRHLLSATGEAKKSYAQMQRSRELP